MTAMFFSIGFSFRLIPLSLALLDSSPKGRAIGRTIQSCGLLGFDFGSGCVGPVLIGSSGWPLLRSPEASGVEKRCLVSIFKTGLPKAPPSGELARSA